MRQRNAFADHACHHRRNLLIAGSAVGFAIAFPQLATAGKLLGVASEVYVNGKRSYHGATIRPGDVVKTGGLSEAVFVVGKDAFMLRQNSEMRLIKGKNASSTVVAGLRLVTGGLLSVFAPGQRKVQTATATAGIRGSACYVEVRPEGTYFCTCYGKVDLSDSAGDATLQVSAEHHDANIVHANAQAGNAIEHTTQQNHYDEELILLTALVGTKPPFVKG
jgi:hypothetical protein